jgi:hypothetical protein
MCGGEDADRAICARPAAATMNWRLVVIEITLPLPALPRNRIKIPVYLKDRVGGLPVPSA